MRWSSHVTDHRMSLVRCAENWDIRKAMWILSGWWHTHFVLCFFFFNISLLCTFRLSLSSFSVGCSQLVKVNMEESLNRDEVNRETRWFIEKPHPWSKRTHSLHNRAHWFIQIYFYKYYNNVFLNLHQHRLTVGWNALSSDLFLFPLLQVTLVRNYIRSCLKRDWLRGRYSHVSSAEELSGRKMTPLDAETWGEILQAELDRWTATFRFLFKAPRALLTLWFLIYFILCVLFSWNTNNWIYIFNFFKEKKIT